MQRPLHEHISHLENKIEAIKAQLEEPNRSAEYRKALKLHLEIAQTSLDLFRKAYELEREISN